MLIEHVCDFCGTAFKQGYMLGAHTISCRSNPRFEEINTKRKLIATKKRARQLMCTKCGVPIVRMLTDAGLARGAYAKHCSRTCANGHQVSSVTKARISNALSIRSRLPEYIEDVCVICGETFKKKRNKHTKTCNNGVCRSQCRSQSLKGNPSGKKGGYRPRNIQTYNGQTFDSKWEVVFAQRLDNLNITWERNITRGFTYVDTSGRERRYFPDFYLLESDTYIEIKGYASPATQHKMSDAVRRNGIKLKILTSLNEIGSFVGR